MREFESDYKERGLLSDDAALMSLLVDGCCDKEIMRVLGLRKVRDAQLRVERLRKKFKARSTRQLCAILGAMALA